MERHLDLGKALEQAPRRNGRLRNAAPSETPRAWAPARRPARLGRGPRGLRIPRAHWIVLASVASAVAAAYAVTLALPTQYEATATVFVGGTASGRDGDSLGAQYASVAQNLVASYAELAETRSVAETAAAAAGLSPAAVAGHVEAEARPGLQVLRIRTDARSASAARRAANGVAVALAEHVERLSGPAGEVGIETVDPAVSPAHAVSPRLVVNLIFGGVVGLLFGVGLALARSRLAPSMKEAAAAERDLGVPVLAVVPSLGRRLRKLAAPTRHAHQGVAEPYRALAAALSSLADAGGKRRFVVAGARGEDDKAIVAAHLALALAEDNRDVALIEGDLRRPSLRRHFPSAAAPGANGALYKTVHGRLPKSAEVVPGLKVLAAGASSPDPAHALRSSDLLHTLEAAARSHDHVLVDAPPVLAVSDATVLGRRADGVLLVAREDASRADVRASCLALRRGGVEPAGIVLVAGKASRRTGYAQRTALSTRVANGLRGTKRRAGRAVRRLAAIRP